MFRNYIQYFLLILFVSCQIPDTKKEIKETNQNSSCPKNQEDFEKIFLFNEIENINKISLRAKHYPISNERRLDLFYPFIKNKKGGYIGVGTDQNLILISWAKSDYAYLIDFDWVAVYINKLHLLFISNSNSFEEFKYFWFYKNKQKGQEIIQNKIIDKKEQEKYFYVYKIGLESMPERFSDLEYITKNFNFISYHNNPEDFNYLKKLIEENKIHPVLGDINGNTILKKIGDSSKKICIPIRILYLSNAEEYYRYPKSFRENISNLFIDEDSLIIRTVTSGALEFGYPDGEKFKEIPFHYNIQKIKDLIEWFEEENLWIYAMLKKNRIELQKGLSFLKRNLEKEVITP